MKLFTWVNNSVVVADVGVNSAQGHAGEQGRNVAQVQKPVMNKRIAVVRDQPVVRGTALVVDQTVWT